MTSVEQFMAAESTLDGAIVRDDEFWVDHGAQLPRENDLVRVTHDIPDLALRRGDMGVVRSRWLAPAAAYEIEFHFFGSDYASRGLLMAGQIEIAERRHDKRANPSDTSHECVDDCSDPSVHEPRDKRAA